MVAKIRITDFIRRNELLALEVVDHLSDKFYG